MSTTAAGGTTDPAAPGLTADEVADRRARGLANDLPPTSTRSVAQILRVNIITYFNLLLGTMVVLILIYGEGNDALFGGVLVANTAIGIIQQLRAKRTLDRLAVLTQPRARVRRDDNDTEVAVNEVVADDLLVLQPGDQIVVDGEVVAAAALEVDESLLTGESEPVVKQPGDEVMSGSFVAAGSGVARATRVGQRAYAAQVAAEARRFTLSSSDLQRGVDRLVRWASIAMVPAGAALLVSQLHIHRQFSNAITAAIGGWVAMIPQGLVLLTSVAFAVGVIRLAQHQVVVQELPAVETLARVDTICLDKTGTITHGDLVLDHVDPRPGVDDRVAREALAALVAADPNPNATLRAVGEGLAQLPHPDAAGARAINAPSASNAVDDGSSRRAPAAGHDADGSSPPLDSSVKPDKSLPPMPEGWTVDRAVPFSSARKWSAAAFSDKGTWVFGAPDVLLRDRDTELRATVEEHAANGTRVVMLAHSDAPLADETLPPDVTPQALALLEDRVRADAPQTLEYFAEQGVTVKVISGDHPSTVAAVARRAGLDLAGDAVDARTLPEQPEQLAQALDDATVFGRVTPQQKRAMVGALQAHGHVVAMTGDGVNDVLALKDADIGVAMGSGSSASRAAAQLVLLTGEFAALPHVVGEGRRVINNVERVANLFITKTVYALLLAVTVSIALDTFPFLPRHFTLIDALTIGIPGFFLALAPNPLPARAGFLRRVVRFSVPYGILVGAATFVAYQIALHPRNIPLEESRTTATLVVVALGLFVLIQLARPMTPWRGLLVGCMVGAFALVMVVPFGRHFFELKMPPWSMLVIATVIVIATVVVGLVADERFAIRAVNQPEMRSAGRDQNDGDAVAAVAAGPAAQPSSDEHPTR